MPEKTKVDPTSKVCIFCNIAQGKIRSEVVYEDKDSIAFLDIRPRSKGMTIVVPKEHYDEIGDNPVESLKTFQSAEIVSQMIKRALDARFVEMGIIRSEDVKHFHIRLYPVYTEERPITEAQPLNMNEPELEALAEKIRSVQIKPIAERQRKKDGGKKWDPEDAKHVRRGIEEA